MGTLSGTNGKSKPKKKVTPHAEFRFLNHSLSSDDKERLRALDIDVEYPLAEFLALAGTGYKVGLSYDERGSCFVASLTDREKTSTFYNACLTGRGSTIAMAVASLLYRHNTLAQGEWGALAAVDSKAGIDFD